MLRINEEYMNDKIIELSRILDMCGECVGDEKIAFYTDDTDFLNCNVSRMSIGVIELVLTFIDLTFIPFIDVAFRDLTRSDVAVDLLKQHGYKEIEDSFAKDGNISVYKEKIGLMYIDLSKTAYVN